MIGSMKQPRPQTSFFTASERPQGRLLPRCKPNATEENDHEELCPCRPDRRCCRHVGCHRYRSQASANAPVGPIKLPPNVKIKTPGPIKIMPIDPITPAKPPVSKGYDDGALAFGLGLATVGVIAAAAASHNNGYAECWYEKRVRYDEDGYKYVKKIRVCE